MRAFAALALVSAGLASLVWLIDTPPATLALLALLPAVLWLLPTRTHVAACCAGYYLAGLSPVITAVDDYFGAALGVGVLAWLALSLLWTLVWCGCWAPPAASRWRRVGGLLLALTCMLAPPLGALAYQQPLLAAGALFPGLGFAGPGLLVFIWCVLAALPLRPAASLAAVALALGLICAPGAGASGSGAAAGVLALQTRTPVPANWPDLALQVQQLAQRSRQADAAQADLLVFPEAAIQTWRPATAQLTHSLLGPLSWQHSLVLGSTLDAARADRSNVALLLERGQIRVMQQRQPLVLGLWAPWRSDHYRADWLAPGVIEIEGRRVALRLCGDELLLGLALIDFWRDEPQLLLGLANHGWSRHAVHERIQARHAQAVAQLFGVPLLRAVNRRPGPVVSS